MKKYQILVCDNNECASRGFREDSFELFEIESESLNSALGNLLSREFFLGSEYEDIYEYMEEYFDGDIEKVLEANKDLLSFYEKAFDIVGGDPYIIWIKENGKKLY